MKPRILALFLALSLLVGLASASSLGSFASKNDKTVDDRDANFYIEVFNLGSEPVKLTVTSTKLDGARVAHPREMTLGSSKITENPSSGGSWFLLKDGKYVETVRIPVELLIERQRPTNVFDFTVNLQAKTETGSTQAGTIQNIAQVRSYNFHVRTTAPRTGSSGDNTQQDTNSESAGFANSLVGSLNDAFNSFRGSNPSSTSFSRDNPTDQSTQTQEENRERTYNTDTSAEYTESEEEIGFETSDKVSVTQQEDPETGKSGSSITGQFIGSASVNSTTFILLLAATVSTLYVFRVL